MNNSFARFASLLSFPVGACLFCDLKEGLGRVVDIEEKEGRFVV
jgi:hypothetical protein